MIQDTRVDVDGMEAVFSVGDKFKSFDELQDKVHRYEELEFVKLWIRDSRTVTAAKKRVTRYLSSQIKYYEITYACIHGGKKFDNVMQGIFFQDHEMRQCFSSYPA